MNAFYHLPYVLILTYRLLLLSQVDQNVLRFHRHINKCVHIVEHYLFLSMHLFDQWLLHQKLVLHTSPQDSVLPNLTQFHKSDQYSYERERPVDLIQYQQEYHLLRKAFLLHVRYVLQYLCFHDVLPFYPLP